MKHLNIFNPRMNNTAFSGKTRAATLLPLLCVLAISTGPAQALEAGTAPSHEQHAGKHGRFGYRSPDHVNKDSYVSDNIYGVENLA